MLTFIRKNILLISVFFTGACVLVVEIAATRILSPFFGSTIFTVSSIISVILAALSLGYYQGGKLSDKNPSMAEFFGLVATSGLSLLFFHYLGKLALPFFSKNLSFSMGPLVSAIFIFFIPAYFMGLLSPYVVKLQSLLVPKEKFGSVAGTTFFWSTFGSITGSLLTGFVFIPKFGVEEIMVGSALALVAYGSAGYIFLTGKIFRPVMISALIAFAVGVSFWTASQAPTVVYAKDGVYEKLSIVDLEYKGRPTRVFKQDKSSSSAMFLDAKDPTDLAFEYARYYKLAEVLDTKIEKAFIIGGGTYSIPKVLLYEYPEARIDVSEIEPSLQSLAIKYFSLPKSDHVTTLVEDGRRLLSDSTEKYDLIFSDVYYSLFSIPAHFTTVEFFQLAKARLDDDGIFVGNMFGDLSRDQDSLILTLMRTFQEVFPNSYFFAAGSPDSLELQNIVFVGLQDGMKLDLDSPLVSKNKDVFIKSLPEHLIDLKDFDLPGYEILRDNYAPVEYYTGKLLKRSNK